jgi:hypothetical protein
MDFSPVRVELAQQKCMTEGDWTQDLSSSTKLELWHHRLGHLGFETLSRLIPSCIKFELEALCHACQLGRHVRLPFATSHSRAIKNFDLIHWDLWTSHVLSVSGFQILPYYSWWLLSLLLDFFSMSQIWHIPNLIKLFCLCTHSVWLYY